MQRASPRTPAGPRQGKLRRVFAARSALPVREVRPSAVIAAEQLEQLQPLINRIVGVLFWFTGYNGTIMMLHGAFVNAIAIPLIAGGSVVTLLALHLIPRRTTRGLVTLGCLALLYAANELAGGLVRSWAIGGGLLYQTVVTLFQWTYCRDKLNPRYLIALAADVAANVRGYGFVMLAPLVAVIMLLARRPWWEKTPSYATPAAWGIIVVFSVVVAVAGEHFLVKK